MKRTLKVEPVPEGAATDPNDKSILSLEFVLEKFGGYSFDFETLDGAKIPVSLEHYRGKDPKKTFLRLSVQSDPEVAGEDAQAEARIQARHGDIAAKLRTRQSE